MAWQVYWLVFRLESPLHVGYRKVGNLMQTRGYVPGKNLWAALTARLTRDFDNGANGQRYVAIGQQVQDHFRFTYLYPATRHDDGWKTHYPWDSDFDHLFLNSYVSVALDYLSQAAEDAMLHETEFIAPYTRTGRPVYLTGDLYVQTGLPTPLAEWPEAFKRLQVGADRGYGWGRLQLVCCEEAKACGGDEPVACVKENSPILAHLKTKNINDMSGAIEPLIGWERNNEEGQPNWSLSKEAVICYAPGAVTGMERRFIIGPYGIWEVEKPEG